MSAYFVAPVAGRISSDYGSRRHPITGAAGFHRGLDIAAPVGTPIVACYGGTVRSIVTNWRSGQRDPVTGLWNTGNRVIIDGPGGGSEFYGHMHTITVKPGQVVKAGDRIGTVGASGNVTGPHLHLEMWNGRTQGGGSGAGNTRDPKRDFATYGIAPGSAGESSEQAHTGGGGGSTSPSGAHVVANATITARLDAAGYPRRQYLKDRIKAAQGAQLYSPGLKADGHWGPFTEAHYGWVREFQTGLNRWQAVTPKLPVDGDYRANTGRGSKQMQDRNANARMGSRPDRRLPNANQRRLMNVRIHPGAS